MNNLYSKFSINSDAASEDIARVYKNIVKKYTAASYKGTKETAEKKLASAKEIYEILSDPVKRAAHDKALNITPESPYIHAAVKSGTKTGAKSGTKQDIKTSTKTDAKTGTKSNTKSDTKTGAKTAAKSTDKSGTKTNNKTGAKTAAKTGVKVKQSLGAETITEDGLSVRTVTYIPLSDIEFEQLLQDILELEGQIDELRGRGQTEKDLQKEIAVLDKKIKKLKVKREKEQAERLKEQIALYDKHLESYKHSPFANSTAANTVEILAADILNADTLSADYETAAAADMPTDKEQSGITTDGEKQKTKSKGKSKTTADISAAPVTAPAEDFAAPFTSGALGAEPEPVAEVITLADAPLQDSGEKKKTKSKKKKSTEPETIPADSTESSGGDTTDEINAVIYVPPVGEYVVEKSAADAAAPDSFAENSVSEAAATDSNTASSESIISDVLRADIARDVKQSQTDSVPEIKSGAFIGQRKGLGRGAFLTIGILLFMMFGVAAYIAAGSLFNTTFIKTYNIEYTASEGGYIEGSANQSVKKGEDGAAVRAVADEGFIFTGWSDGQTNPERTDYKIGQDFSVRAEFVKGIKVTYLTDGNGHISGGAVQYVLPGGDAEKVCAEGFNGFAFDKWSDGIETEERHDKSISSEIEITAYFVRGFMLIYNAEPGGRIEGKPVQAVKPGLYGQTVKAVAEDGYRFIGWSKGFETEIIINYEAERTDLADDNKIFTAHFIRVYSFTYSAGGGGSISGSSSQTVAKNSHGSLVTAIPDDGYIFDYWLVNGVKDTTQTFEERQEIDATENLDIVAVFTPQYTVTYSVQIIDTDTPGSISGTSPQYVKDGLNADSVTAIAKDDRYIFDYWLVNGVKDTVNTGITRTDAGVIKTLNIVAVFIRQYRVLYAVQLIDGPALVDGDTEPGSISGETEQYVRHGGNAESVSALAKSANYAFVYWLKNGNSESDTERTDTNIQSDITVTAFFTRKYSVQYTVSGDGGNIFEGTANKGKSVTYSVLHNDAAPTVKAVFDTGYKFKEWNDDVLIPAQRTDSPVTSNLTITATFEETPFYGGDGSSDTPYGINNAKRFMLFASGQSIDGNESYGTKHFILTDDIDLSEETGFSPMYTGGFSGTLDGGGKKITGLNISANDTNYVGLFARLNSGAVIMNLNIESANIILESSTSSNVFLGILSGYSFADISGVTVSGNIKSVSTCSDADNKIHYIGGLTGYAAAGLISGCSADTEIISDLITGSFDAKEYIGGLAAFTLNNAAISNCYANSKIVLEGNIKVTAAVMDAVRNGFAAVTDTKPGTGYIFENKCANLS